MNLQQVADQKVIRQAKQQKHNDGGAELNAALLGSQLVEYWDTKILTWRYLGTDISRYLIEVSKRLLDSNTKAF